MVGGALPPLCPRATLTLPWVVRATRAYSWREKGALAAIEPAPPAALLEAVDVVAEGVGAAQERTSADARARTT